MNRVTMAPLAIALLAGFPVQDSPILPADSLTRAELPAASGSDGPARAVWSIAAAPDERRILTLDLRIWDESEAALLLAVPARRPATEHSTRDGLLRIEFALGPGDGANLTVAGPTGLGYDLRWIVGGAPRLARADYQRHALRRSVAMAGRRLEFSADRQDLVLYAQTLGGLHSAEDAAGLCELGPDFVARADRLGSASMAAYGRVLLTWAFAEGGAAAAAVATADQARAAAAAAGIALDPTQMVELERSACRAHLQLEQPGAAAECARRLQAVPELEAIAGPELAPRTWAGIAEFHWRRFHPAEARRCFQAALDSASESCPPEVRFRLQRHLALACHEIGDYASAQALLDGLDERADVLPASELVLLRIQRADFERELGFELEALASFESAERIAEQEGLASYAAQARLYRADFLVTLGRAAEAFPLFRAVAEDPEAHRLYRARAATGLGLESLEDGDAATALEIADTALTSFQPGDPIEWSLHAHALRIAALLQAGELEDAERALLAAEAVLEEPALRERNEDVAFLLSRYRGLSALAMDLAAARIERTGDGDATAALFSGWNTACLWKGRTVLESISRDEEAAGEWRLDSTRLRSGLPPEVVLVDFVLGRQRLYAFRWHDGAASFHDLGNRAEVEGLARRLSRSLARAAGTADWLPAAVRLRETLMDPLLPAGATRLIVVPAGELCHLPFEALVRWPESADPAALDPAAARFLLEDAELSYAPSVPVLLRLQEPRLARDGRVVVVADPEFTGARLPALPGTRTEAEAILAAAPGAVHLSGAGCRREQIFPLLPEARWLHFGTHARQDRFFPGRSTLALAGDGREDLTLEEIAAMRLAAEVTVLSACDTATGWDLPGDGLQSIASAFLRAGSRGVVGSLWPVQDAQAAVVMADFSRRALADGQAPAAALQEAKRAFLSRARAASAATADPSERLLRGGRGLGEAALPEAGLLHPFYWAAFTYTGGFAPSAPLSARSLRTPDVMIVKLRDGTNLPYENNAHELLGGQSEAGWQQLSGFFPGIELDPTYPLNIRESKFSAWIEEQGFSSQDPTLLQQFGRMRLFYQVTLAPGQDPSAFRSEALGLVPDFELVYLRTRGSSPAQPASAARSAAAIVDYFKDQTYLQATDWSPPDGSWNQDLLGGIGVANLWTKADGTMEPGSDGEGVTALVIERDWLDSHSDLPGSKITLEFGDREAEVASVQHGTGTLGVLAALDDGQGVKGIAPGLKDIFLGTYLTGSPAAGFVEDIDNAILLGADELAAGDVMLLEIQTAGAVDPLLDDRPVEIYPEIFEAIRLATLLGIVVVEPAGNSGRSLDELVAMLAVLGYTADSYVDSASGAVLVGASYASRIHPTCTPYSCYGVSGYGSMLHAFAFGSDVITTWVDVDGVTGNYTSNQYNSTSSASAIVAGAACVLQGVALQKIGRPLTPEEMVAMLSDEMNTESCSEDSYWIGRMPNLPELVEKHPTFTAGADLFVRDEDTDDGSGLSSTVFLSPDIVIWSSSTAPTGVSDLLAGSSAPAAAGTSPSAYVVARNRGLAASSDGEAWLYWARSTTLPRPTDFTLVGKCKLAAVPAGDALLSDPFTPPAGIPADLEGCLLAVLSASGDPASDFTHLAISSPERFKSFVLHRNNFALRTVVVKPFKKGTATKTSLRFSAGGGKREARMDLEIESGLPAGATLRLLAPPEFLQLLPDPPRPERRPPDARSARGFLSLPANGNFRFADLAIPARSDYPLVLEAELPPIANPRPFRITAQQRWKGKIVGRMEFVLMPEGWVPDPGFPGRRTPEDSDPR